MIDIKLLAIQDLLVVRGVNYAQGVSPLSVIILGEKFTEATEIQINDEKVPEYIVLSDTKILAQVPTSQVKALLRKVAVIAEQPSVNRSSLLTFTVGTSFKTLTGIERMVQIFVKLLLQTPGTDRFHRGLGGGLLEAVGRNVSRKENNSVQSLVLAAVNRTRDQLTSIQAKNPDIPADERLLSANTEGVGFDAQTTTLSARVVLSAVSGKAAVANLSF